MITLAATAGSLHAGTLTYNFQLATPDGHPVTHLALYATNGAGLDDVYLSPVQLAASGTFQLQHTVAFDATSVFVLGITERDKDDLWDLIMFTSDSYAASSYGHLYNELFPSPANLGHNAVPVVLQAAHAGDATALATLTNFLRGPGVSAGYFDPTGSFTILKFSTPTAVGGDIPEPSSFALIAGGIVALALHRTKA